MGIAGYRTPFLFTTLAYKEVFIWNRFPEIVTYNSIRSPKEVDLFPHACKFPSLSFFSFYPVPKMGKTHVPSRHSMRNDNIFIGKIFLFEHLIGSNFCTLLYLLHFGFTFEEMNRKAKVTPLKHLCDS